MNQIVATLRPSDNKAEFYKILFSHKDLTILSKQSTDTYNIYAYNNKTRRTGKLPIEGNLEVDKIKRLVEIGLKVIWLDYPMLFFWADSRLITDYGLPKYENLLNIHDSLLLIKKDNMDCEDNIKAMKKESFIHYLLLKFIYMLHRANVKIRISSIIKELKIIW